MFLVRDNLYSKENLIVSPNGTLWFKDTYSLFGKRLASVDDFNLEEDCKGFAVFYDRLMSHFDECKLYMPEDQRYLSLVLYGDSGYTAIDIKCDNMVEGYTTPTGYIIPWSEALADDFYATRAEVELNQDNALGYLRAKARLQGFDLRISENGVAYVRCLKLYATSLVVDAIEEDVAVFDFRRGKVTSVKASLDFYEPLFSLLSELFVVYDTARFWGSLDFGKQ